MTKRSCYRSAKRSKYECTQKRTHMGNHVVLGETHRYTHTHNMVIEGSVLINISISAETMAALGKFDTETFYSSSTNCFGPLSFCHGWCCGPAVGVLL